MLTPLNVITSIVETALCDNVAETEAPFNTFGANARQISDVPICAFVLATSVHVKPPPETLCTVVLGEPVESAEMNASSNSFSWFVVNPGLETTVLGVFWSKLVRASITMPPELVVLA